MRSWQKVKISSFLFERDGRYKPEDETISNLQRIEKIDFTGKFYISGKRSRTDMILVRPGDLVISGINVTKGAMGIYEGIDDVTATIHYSSYNFDQSIINVEFFKRFLKSTVFINLLKEQVKGGIKTEIKPKHLLPLEIFLPGKPEQDKIVEHFKSCEGEVNEISSEIIYQQSLLKKLRQSILQDGVSGKLTDKWRKDNPCLPATELLERIKAEKERLVKEKKIKKPKLLPPITEDEIPFELPEGWEWCRLGNIITFNYGKGIVKENIGGKFPAYGANGILKYVKKPLILTRCIIVGRKGSAGILNIVNEPFWPTDVTYFVTESTYLDFFFVYNLLKSLQLEKLSYGIKPGLNRNDAYNLLIALPPLEEQKAIVAKVEKLFAYCDELEQQISKSQQDSELLMQAVLKEAFETK